MSPIAILPARMQPPHNDHLAIVERAISLLRLPIVVALLVGGGRVSDPFGLESDEHHAPERNPFSFPQRAALLEAALSQEMRGHVRIVPLPRPECAWDQVCATFPGPRLWIVPDAGDPFDDAKAAWFAARSEGVARPRITPTTDGRLVRALVARGDPALRDHVPAAVADLLQEWREERSQESERRSTWTREPE